MYFLKQWIKHQEMFLKQFDRSDINTANETMSSVHAKL